MKKLILLVSRQTDELSLFKDVFREKLHHGIAASPYPTKVILSAFIDTFIIRFSPDSYRVCFGLKTQAYQH